MYEAREQLPGVKETVITIVFSPSHFLCSTMMLEWVSTSCDGLFLRKAHFQNFEQNCYLRVEMRQFIGLGVHPSQGLHLLQVGVLRQLLGQVHLLVGAPLRRQHDAANFFHLKIVFKAIFTALKVTFMPGDCQEAKHHRGSLISGSSGQKWSQTSLGGSWGRCRCSPPP